MQVKAISEMNQSDRLLDEVPGFVADGDEITSVTVVEGSPAVSVAVPVSLVLLESACWNDQLESAASVEAMSDDEVRAWALTALLISGVVGAATGGRFSSALRTAESDRYLAVIRGRLPRAFGLASPVRSGTAA